jgi:hypothetical protein
MGSNCKFGAMLDLGRLDDLSMPCEEDLVGPGCSRAWYHPAGCDDCSGQNLLSRWSCRRGSGARPPWT